MHFDAVLPGVVATVEEPAVLPDPVQTGDVAAAVVHYDPGVAAIDEVPATPPDHLDPALAVVPPVDHDPALLGHGDDNDVHCGVPQSHAAAPHSSWYAADGGRAPCHGVQWHVEEGQDMHVWGQVLQDGTLADRLGFK